MTEQANLQDQLFTLAGEIEQIKDNLKAKQAQLEQVLQALGVNTYHQDEITGAVFKVYVPEGTFVSFKKIDYKRTSLPGEKGGTVLSKAEAESMGFKLSK